MKDPSKPAGYVFPEDVNEDGSATRNDGRKLKSARKNPWYVLATIFGEQEEGELDKGLANQNQRIWNGWLCGSLPSSKRSEISKLVGFGEGNLSKLEGTQKSNALQAFRERVCDEKAELPNPNEKIDFSDLYFEKTLVLERHVFSKESDFSGSVFSKHLNCRSAVFNGATVLEGAVFESASFYFANFLEEVAFSKSEFCEYATFYGATFFGGANFRDVVFYDGSIYANAVFKTFASFKGTEFRSKVSFYSVKFGTLANFEATCFNFEANYNNVEFLGDVNFSNSEFLGLIKFNSSVFAAETTFENAKFFTHVPEFHGAKLYDHTLFTLPDSNPCERGFWPPLKTNGVAEIMSSAKQKAAYNRLRLFMNKSMQTESEQFFHRREMACKKVLEGRFMFGVYSLYGLLSNYGHSVGRPLSWLIANVGVGGVWFFNYLWWYHKPVSAWSAVDALGISFANVFPFFGFGRRFVEQSFYENLGRWATTFAGVQTVLGFILLFLLGLGLRNRFRLR